MEQKRIIDANSQAEKFVARVKADGRICLIYTELLKMEQTARAKFPFIRRNKIKEQRLWFSKQH